MAQHLPPVGRPLKRHSPTRDRHPGEVMRTNQLFTAVVALAFVTACDNQAPNEEQGLSREGLQAQMKAQTNSAIDGGVAAMAAVAPAQLVQPPTISATATVTNSVTSTVTMTATGSIVTNTTTGTVTKTDTQTATATQTFSATGVVTATFTGTKTGTLTSSGTKTATNTATATSSWTGTYRGTGTATGTKTLTATLTGTATATGTLSITATGTKTNTATKSVTGTGVGTGSKTVTQTYTAAPTVTATSTATTTGTNTATYTKTGTVVTTATGTGTTTVTNLCYGTWAFCDNFETGNGSGWNVQQGPVQNFAVVGDGTKVYRQSDATASQLYISRAQAAVAWLDSTVEANLKPLSFSSSSASVSLWGRYDATWNADCGYYVSLRGDGTLALGKRVAGVNTAIGSPVAVPGGISAGTWYDVKLAMQGTSLVASVNGTQLLSQTDSTCTSGSVGVGSLGASFESDDVRVSAPATNACVQNWKNTPCGEFCTYEVTVQGDRVGCGAYLDCYAANGCSPETCGGPDDVCGVNRPGLNGWGTASKEVADQVYKCLGCAGSVNCANPKYYNGTVCADGSPCTFGDTCQNGVCTPDPNRNTKCSAADQCHDVGTCDTTTGICNNPPFPDQTLCDDQNACTPNSMCMSGICTGQNPKVCPASDQCLDGVCNPGNGECFQQPKQDGTACNDGDACTQTDACQQGSCKGADPVICTVTNPNCYTPGACDSNTGACADQIPIDKISCNVFLQVDGVVKVGDNEWIALFGWHSTATSQFHPTIKNEVTVSTGQVPSDSPNPPAYLIPGNHPGGFLAHFTTGQTIKWTVDTTYVDASTASPILIPTPLPSGGGQQVELPDGTKVVITPDMFSYSKAPSDPDAGADPTHGGTFNDALSGSLTISPTGAAIYTVPISIPPGIAGMAPNLSLVYNSQAGDGIAGQGWQLAGLSTIYRCPKTLAQDGYSKTVEMDDTIIGSEAGDGVCLDGQRLFKVGGIGPLIIFRTEFDDFSSVLTDGQKFLVNTKSGEMRVYGLTSNARVLLPKEDASGIVTSESGTPGTVTAVWALEKVVDLWNNYYEIHYNYDKGNDIDPVTSNSDFQSRGLIVTEIKYTGNSGGGSDPELKPFYSITFDYAFPTDTKHRPDVRNLRFRDSVLPLTSLLTSITTPRGVYSLTYAGDGQSANSDPMQPSRLVQIQYCTGTSDAPGPCLLPLKFSWNEGGYSWEPSGPYENAPTNYALPTSVNGPGTQFLDLDGDGLLDFVQARDGQTPTTWRNTGKGWEQKDNWSLPVMLAKSDGTLRGTRFADVDGDGLPDLISDHANKPMQEAVWLNRSRKQQSGGTTDPPATIWEQQTGTGGLSGYRIQLILETTPPDPTNSNVPDWNSLYLTPDTADRIADIDGDGRAEIIHFGRVHDYPDSDGKQPTPPYLHPVYVLRNVNQQWELDQSYSFLSPLTHSYVYGLKDINRDGLPDILGFPGISGGANLLNTGNPSKGENGTVWKTSGVKIAGPWGGASTPNLMAYGDIDGDGQLDAFGQTWDATLQCTMTGPGVSTELRPVVSKVSLAAGLGWTSAGLSGYQAALDAFTWSSPCWEINPMLEGAMSAGRFGIADLNADGLVDLVIGHEDGGQALINTGATWVDLNGATGCKNCSSTSTGTAGLNPIPQAFAPGYVGALYLEGKSYAPFDAFVDLDGDGVTDHIQTVLDASGTPGKDNYAKRAWLNKFQPPVIGGFPNGLANATEVVFTTITKAAARTPGGTYSDDYVIAAGMKLMIAPLRVVASVSADDGVGGTGKTTYSYSNLRASASGRGSQGFSSITATDPSGMVTTTTYAQAYPYTGKPIQVMRQKNGPVTVTKTDYCDAVAPDGGSPTCTPITGESTNATGKSVFVYPLKVTDTSYLRTSLLPETGKETITTTTEYVYDDQGNPTSTIVTAAWSTGKDGCSGSGTGTGGTGGTSSGTTAVPNCGEVTQRKVVNQYGDEGSATKLRGKVIHTEVTTTRLSPSDTNGNDAITHKTDFEYSSDTLALTKKMVEQGAKAPIELHTAYDYDHFGNLTVSTECASDFEACIADSTRSAGPTDPSDPDHPLFRTTTTSYKIADFTPPVPAGGSNSIPTSAGLVTSLSPYYGDGRFPVKTTNAANQSQYTAYDPLLGVLVQSTGPNGVYTCYGYDPLGWKASETARCGSGQPLTTTSTRFYTTSDGSQPNEKIVTVTTPPTNSTSWTYADKLGRTVRTVSHSFDGGFNAVRTVYDNLGRILKVSKPAPVEGEQFWTTSFYDFIGRSYLVSQDLGPIDGTVGSPSERTANTFTTYNGSSITTQSTVNGVTRTRTEQKNGIGKVSSVTDANGLTISYTYDAEGNLTQTLDPAKNKVNILYDERGRKKLSVEPDLGAWTYKYNGFGDLVEQNDGAGYKTMLTYDVLGRVTRKTYKAGTSDATTAEWVYDIASGAGVGKLAAMISPQDPGLKLPCSIPNTTQTSGNRAGRWFSYSPVGDISETFECVDGDTFSTQYEYDGAGRQKVVRYPEVGGSRFAVKYNYTSLGYLQYVSDVADDKVYWQAKAMNALGQVTDELTRNGVETISTRSPASGWLLDQTATAHADGENLIQGLQYAFDEVGNVLSRRRSEPRDMADSAESFSYDMLDRLKTSEAKISSEGYDVTEGFDYDPLGIGNLVKKGNKTYDYSGCGGRPHAVCQVGDTSYAYDANGNMTSASLPIVGTGKAMTYNAANKVTRITNRLSIENGAPMDVVEFIYGADGNRVVQSVGTSLHPDMARTLYVGLGDTGKSIYERTRKKTTAGDEITFEHVHFIYAGGAHGGNAFALRVVTEDTSSTSQPNVTNPPTMKYNHFDHLGSVTATSDEMGKVVGLAQGGGNATVFAYDAWGARRSPDGKAADPATLALQVGHREFTGHETIPSVGLVNMNGRVYDPELGRFLSPDPNVQFVADLQSYNRYSYVKNNPLRYTDPTGFAWYSFLGTSSFYGQLAYGVGMVVVGTAACAGTSGTACVAFVAFAAVSAGATAEASGASFGQTVGAAIVGAALSYVGGQATSELTGAWAVVGGAASSGVSSAMTTVLFGGNLGQSFLTGLVTGAAGSAMAWSIQGTNAVSQASAEQQGGGGGGGQTSGGTRVETVETILAEAGYGGSGPSDEEIMALVRPRDWTNDISFLMSRNSLYLGDPLSPDEVISAMVAIDHINSTPSGAAELEELANKPQNTVISRTTGGKTVSYYNEIMVDPQERLCLNTENPRGWDRNVLESQIAHEGGHLLGGQDVGPFGGINNTNQYENPVRIDLGLYRRNQMGFATCGGP
jgi:RHS repeat-associated protein